ncbi:MAG: PHP domain-containing protein [candidate division WOR-3 bacterium]
MSRRRDEAVVDLHIHTVFSDGLFTPEQVVIRAQQLGFTAVAITDHDSVDGIERARQQGRRCGVEVVPGAEFSCNVNGADVHILGYCFDYQNPKIQRFFNEVREFRLARAGRMVAKLNELSAGRWQVSLERVKEIAGAGAVGRPHIAQALVEAGGVASMSEAFEKYIGYDGPAYFPKMRLSPGEVIELIHRTGGVAVVAHPATYGNDGLVYLVIAAGIDGIEVWHPEHNQRAVDHYLEMAQKNGLLVTGGSDCHGGRKFGQVYLGEVRLPYQHLMALKRRAKRC